MQPANKFTRFYNFLANLGLVIRDDPPKVIDLTGREWGPAVNGLRLSLRELPREDPMQVTGVSVVMRNIGTTSKQITVPPWVFFYRIHGLELTPYGRQFMNAGPRGQNTDLTLKPGDAIETDLPLSTMYNMRAPGQYRVQVSAPLPDTTELQSNEIAVRV